MQTRALKTLARVANVGSFAVAAEQLNMTLSAVSMQMKMLERELGVVLFDRTFRPPKLTPMGRTVLRHARDLLAVEEALFDICRPGDQLTGRFRIGFVSMASVRLLPDFLINARQQAPNAQFDLETGLSRSLEARVVDGQLDAAVITTSGETEPQLRYDTLREEALIFAVPRRAKARTAGALIEELPFLHFMPTSGIGKLIAAHVSEFDPERRRSTLVLDNVEAIMECVKRGIGFTLLPQPDVDRYRDDSVALIVPKTFTITRRLVLATLAGGTRTGHADLLVRLFSPPAGQSR